MRRLLTILKGPILIGTSALIALSLPACGEDDDNPLKSVKAFCTSWAKRACSDETVDNCAASSDEKCQDAQQEYCEDRISESKYNVRAADKCLDAVRGAFVDGKLDADEYDVVFNLGGDCELILSGDGVEGDECDEHSDCDRTQDYQCIIAPGDDEGTCQQAEIVGGGRSCRAENKVCEEGFYCNGDNCVEEPVEGDDCSAEQPCGKKYRCMMSEADAGASGGICEDRLKTGEEGCESDLDCVSNICEKGSDRSVCVPELQLSATKEICDDFR